MDNGGDIESQDLILTPRTNNPKTAQLPGIGGPPVWSPEPSLSSTSLFLKMPLASMPSPPSCPPRRGLRRSDSKTMYPMSESARHYRSSASAARSSRIYQQHTESASSIPSLAETMASECSNDTLPSKPCRLSSPPTRRKDRVSVVVVEFSQNRPLWTAGAVEEEDDDGGISDMQTVVSLTDDESGNNSNADCRSSFSFSTPKSSRRQHPTVGSQTLPISPDLNINDRARPFLL